MLTPGMRVLRRADPYPHDDGVPRCPFVDDGVVQSQELDDGRVLVRWRLSGRTLFEKTTNLVEWKC